MQSTFLPIVKESKLDKFKLEWHKWLVLSNTIEDEKCPGKLKPEFSTTNGEMIALCPKNYFAYCYDTSETKDGRKGIPKWAELTMNDFRETLYHDNKDRNVVEVKSLRLDRQNKQMTRTTTRKAGLSGVHVKLRVATDRITCTPLVLPNGKYI